MEIQNMAGYWHKPPEPLDLPENAVHLWSVNLEWASNSLQDFGKNLTADEQARAACIRSPMDRKYFIAGRGVLRDILSRYICQAPIDIDLSYGLYRKPRLRPSSRTSQIFFNVSHSESLGLIAVTRGGEVGIDLERIKPCEDCEKIAERFFSPPEIQALRRYLPPLRRDAFLTIWTRKEAFTNALGVGLQLDWSSFDVSRVPAPAVQTPMSSGTSWSIYPFVPTPGYVAALAYEASAPILKFWEWLGLASASRATQLPRAAVSINE